MNETIVKHALRELIIYTPAATEYTRAEALDELLRMEREAIRKEAKETNAVHYVNNIGKWNGNMQEFRQHRANHDRISTVKLVRERIGCGLSEALIIVKGIETQDNIPGLT